MNDENDTYKTYFASNERLIAAIIDEMMPLWQEKERSEKAFDFHFCHQIMIEQDEELSGIAFNNHHDRVMRFYKKLDEALLDVRASFLLQFAKQFLSMKYAGDPRNKGKMEPITGLPIGSVVVAARNQAIHFEEKQFSSIPMNKIDVETWRILNKSCDNNFPLPSNRSYAIDIVVQVLRWKDIEIFKDSIF